MGRRGLALLIVVGVTALLSSLSAAFLTLARLERRGALQRMMATRAALLARSGLEDALARLEAGQDPGQGASRYAGEDWNANGVLDGVEVQAEVFRRGGAGALPDTSDCPLRHALRPSFPLLAGGANPRLQTVEGRLRGMTGKLAGDQSGRSNHYAVRVEADAGLFVNGGDPERGPAQGYNAVLGRLLGTLVEAVGQETGLPLGRADGEGLVRARPRVPGGWSSFEQVRDTLWPGDARAQEKLEALRPYLTLDAWVDRKVIAPTPAPVLASMVDGAYACWADLKLNRRALLAPAGARVITGFSVPDRTAPGFESIGGRVVGRAPVDLAWARTRRPVLIALLSGLKGLYLDESTARNDSITDAGVRRWGNELAGTLRAVEIPPVDWALAADECRDVADQILAYAGPLDTWERWNAFCDGLAVPGSPDQGQAKRDLLKANFNPNSGLNKFNPDRSLWRSVDKSDLLVYSTEFSLAPAQGFRLESLGRLLDLRGRVLASRSVQARTGRPGILRITTQRELVCDELGDPDLAGDEGPARAPAEFLGPSNGPGTLVTWGHALPGVGGKGTGLQVYPQPWVTAGGALGIEPADWDGCLRLSTLETARDDCYGAAGAPQEMKMLARFDDGFDLDELDGADPGCIPDVEQVSGAALRNGLLAPSAGPYRVNTLYPDGAYAERGRSPAWHDRGNAHAHRGLMSFWVKPNYVRDRTEYMNAGWARRGRVLVSRTNYVAGSEVVGGANEWEDQFWMLVEYGKTAPLGRYAEFSFVFEVDHQRDDTGLESMFQMPNAPDRYAPHRWHLMTLFWNAKSSGGAEQDRAARMLLDEGRVKVSRPPAVLPGDAIEWQTYSNYIDSGGATDLTLPDLTGPHKLSLGQRHDWPGLYVGRDRNLVSALMGDGADSTFDEFVVYDLGTDPGASNVLALSRYRDGRYAKGAAYAGLGSLPPNAPPTDLAGSYFSPRIRLPGGSVLRRVLWTWIRPAELPDDYAEIALVKSDVSGAKRYLWNAARSRSVQAPGWDPGRQAWEVGLPVEEEFRLQAVFRCLGGGVRADPDTPVLDSPALDDLTLVYGPAGGPGIRGWEEGG